MHKHTPKLSLHVRGSMNQQDAGHVGRTLADAARFLAVCAGIALLIYVIRWW